MIDLPPELLLHAYASGVFPMAESRDSSEVRFVDPRQRGIFDLHNFHISRSLSRSIRVNSFTFRTNSAFEAVLDACADRPETWINATIRQAYIALYQMGHAHAQEVWDGDELVGGVYGVSLGAAFFGESMFSRRTNASKMALAYLMHRLRAGGFTLFDTQFLTPHLASLGAIEISRAQYHQRLEAALKRQGQFNPDGYQPSVSSVLSAAGSSGAG
jgi:leucyl/phenylalanyl-tRNA--protein transferase